MNKVIINLEWQLNDNMSDILRFNRILKVDGITNVLRKHIKKNRRTRVKYYCQLQRAINILKDGNKI